METPIKKVLNAYENQVGLKLTPNRRFYNRVGINQKRFGQLIRGEKNLLLDEAVRLSDFFKVPLDELCINEKPGHYSR